MHAAPALQIIRTTWTKKSRGAPLSTLRNAVPLALPLGNLQNGFLNVQHVYFAESDLFRTPQIKPSLIPLTDDFYYTWDDFVLNWNEHQLTTDLRSERWEGSEPRPKSFDARVGHFLISSGEWGRLRWHNRFSDYDTGNWWYEHTCINVAHFEGNEDPKLCLHSQPTRQFTHLPQLQPPCPRDDVLLLRGERSSTRLASEKSYFVTYSVT